MRISSVTKDNITVQLIVKFFHLPDENNILKHHTYFKDNYFDDALEYILNESINSSVERYSSFEILEEKDIFLKSIAGEIESLAKRNFIIIEIKDIQLMELPREIMEVFYTKLLKQTIKKLNLKL